MAVILYTYDNGVNSPETIVFIHGAGLSHRAWLPIIERLDDIRCLAVDLPEHGKSTDSSFTLDNASREVAEVIRTLVPKGKAVVAGHSLGGAVLLTLLGTRPEVACSAIITGSADYQAPWLVNMSLPLAWLASLMSTSGLIRWTLKTYQVPQEYYGLIFDDLWHASKNYALDKRLLRSLTWLKTPDELSVPLLACTGEKEPEIAKNTVRRLKKHYSNVKGFQVPGGTHMWPLQFPELFARMVRAWIMQEPLPQELRPL